MRRKCGATDPPFANRSELRNLLLRRAKTILRCCIFDTRKRTIVPKVGISRRASFLQHGLAKATVSIENLRDESIIMHYSETLSLHDRYHDGDLDPVDLDDGPSRPRHTESMAFGSKPARFRSDNASIRRRNAQTCSLFVCGSNRRCWYACLAVPRSSSDAQDLGSVARLVVTHVGDEGSRPGCNFCGITAAA